MTASAQGPIQVACIGCGSTFDARLHAGLVRCPPCDERHAPVMPSVGGTIVVLDTPGEAWA